MHHRHYVILRCGILKGWRVGRRLSLSKENLLPSSGSCIFKHCARNSKILSPQSLKVSKFAWNSSRETGASLRRPWLRPWMSRIKCEEISHIQTQVPVELSKYELLSQPPWMHLTLPPSYVHVLQSPGQAGTYTDRHKLTIHIISSENISKRLSLCRNQWLCQDEITMGYDVSDHSGDVYLILHYTICLIIGVLWEPVY